MKLTLKKNTVMQLSNDLDVVPMSQTKDIAGGGTNGCAGTYECEHSGQCPTTPHMCNNQNTNILNSCMDACFGGGGGFGQSRVFCP
ncbi:hypothetical protein PSECIP111854_00469 [Pseudoalteromonas sp. CIP111854]|uniref:Uncharacterized protein n=1 Tax=Pseudoalteromonas holothuriae TaxID=2963714 RepID=A0A9W4QRL0_9GAMM|nr:hypothetical protein [Pseudoalteromonas sp. CIP111854]CAH9050142.1 hypothetical protein PSECIP111854_00469 [Pseudoalteromonas sp. CIP111854]